ncbi:uncharacterized protein B0T15DRAFT_519872, partial [Chaetomium strumarium]
MVSTNGMVALHLALVLLACYKIWWAAFWVMLVVCRCFKEWEEQGVRCICSSCRLQGLFVVLIPHTTVPSDVLICLLEFVGYVWTHKESLA